MDFRLPTGLSLSPLLRCCSGPSKATRRRAWVSPAAEAQNARFDGFRFMQALQLAVQPQIWLLGSKTNGQSLERSTNQKTKMIPISMISFKMDTFLS